tara:strand:- start:1 stop:477 length:477 start_codon:yes stop_codon:yes gene_type:complete
LGFLKFPETVENYYMSSLGNSWVDEIVFYEELEDRFPTKIKEYKELKGKNFMVFFTTDLQGQQHDGWEQLMMAVGNYKESKTFGTSIHIKAIFRYGFAVKSVFSLNDVVGEIEEYFPEGLKHLDLANDENMYYTYLGFVSDFDDMVKDTQVALKGAKF